MAAGRSFFLTLDTTSRGKHFHEPGGIHLILPSLFTYYYTDLTIICQDKNAVICIFFAITITAISSVKTKMRY